MAASQKPRPSLEELWTQLEALPVTVKGESLDDRAVKQPFYRRMGVAWLWLVDSREQTIQVSELADGHWVIQSVCSNEPTVRLSPFEQLELPLRNVWPMSSG